MVNMKVRNPKNGDPSMTVSSASERMASLEARLQSLHGITRPEILEAISYLRDPGDTVVVTGSLAFGCGNHLSDLDIIIVGGAAFHSTKVPLEHFVGSLRIDVWKLSQDAVDSVFREAARAFEDPQPIGDVFSNPDNDVDLKLLHRIAFSLVWDGSPIEIDLADPAGLAGRLASRQYVERTRHALALADLAATARHEDAWHARVINGHWAVATSIQAVLLRRGVPFLGDKWLGEVLPHVSPELVPVLEDYRPTNATTSERSAEYLQRAKSACRQLLGVDLSTPEYRADLTWRCLATSCTEVSGRYLLVQPEHGFIAELDLDSRDTWRRLQDLATQGDDGYGFADRELDDSQRRMVFEFGLAGLLEPRWSRGVRLEHTVEAVAS